MVTILRHLIFSLIASLLHLMTKITDDGLQPCYALQAQEVLMLEASSRVEHFRKKKKKDSCTLFQKVSMELAKLLSTFTVCELQNLEGFFFLMFFRRGRADTKCFCFTTVKNQTISINFQ